ncbi:MAG: hypothetical protein AAGM67_15135 [Bacteroidota bacterium]
MPRATAINQRETEQLRQAIEVKFLQECSHVTELKKNSYKENYRDLWQHMSLVVPSHKEEFSISRLRKLFYDTPEQTGESKVFGEAFLDACYLYISHGEEDRSSFLHKGLFDQAASQNVSSLSTKFSQHHSRLGFWQIPRTKWLTGLVVGVCLGLFFTHSPRVLWWLVQPEYVRWVCVYEDGTKVYNHFRAYRSQGEVESYFRGKSQGDCNAFAVKLMEDADAHTLVSFCFDPSSAKEHQERHGEIIKVQLTP